MKNEHLIKALFVGAVVTALAGCSSPAVRQAKETTEAAKIYATADKERKTEQEKAMAESVSATPKWALQAPPPDAGGIYAVGIGASADMKISIRKAYLDAEYGLAKSFNQVISGSEKSFTSEDRVGGIDRYTRLVETLVANAPITGFQTIKQNVSVVNGKYSTFILMRLPFEEMSSTLRKTEEKNRQRSIDAQFAALEKKVAEAKEKASQNKAGNEKIEADKIPSLDGRL